MLPGTWKREDGVASGRAGKKSLSATGSIYVGCLGVTKNVHQSLNRALHLAPRFHHLLSIACRKIWKGRARLVDASMTGGCFLMQNNYHSLLPSPASVLVIHYFLPML